MKTYERVDLQIHIFLISARVGGVLSTSRSGSITTRERVPGTHRIGGWVDPRAGLGDVESTKILPVPGLGLRTFGRPARR
jgi:hypothetical protein